jgi:thiol-disulfide isomerase/thioredoxin
MFLVWKKNSGSLNASKYSFFLFFLIKFKYLVPIILSMKNGILLLLCILLLVGCEEWEVTDDPPLTPPDDIEEIIEKQLEEAGETGEELEQAEEELEEVAELYTDSFLDYELTDVLTEGSFRLSDFAGRPVILESFAVWCPTCTSQQENLKDMHKEVGDSVVSVSLDTDPNEDEDTVKEHAESNGFDWRYSISPTELTDMLIDEFGYGIISAPSVPIVLICEDQSYRMLDSGKKSVDELKEELEAGC